MKLDFRIVQEFGCETPIRPMTLATIFKGITQQLDLMLGTKKKWYEQGYSRKQALQHQVFIEDDISKDVLVRWGKKYEKDYPNWTTGIWDGGPDEDSCGIDCYPSYSSLGRRNNPLSIVISFYVDLNEQKLNVDTMLRFLDYLLKVNNNFTNLYVESAGYSFPEIITKDVGYTEVFKKVFPDRISCGWMVYIPFILLPELIPEAARVVPVIHEGQQKGTIIVSTEDVFDGNNKEHIGKANDVEIKLLDLGFLPLMTEL
ncbi:Imm52 family immunity protein [Yersinia intermedia]|nr:Imm52 family immunity protein [Yersinia intermedia]